MSMISKSCLSNSLIVGDYELYDKLEMVGTGSFGSVFRCKDTATAEEFAMKKILIKDQKFEDSVVKEVCVLAALAPHDRLVQFYGSKRKQNSLHIFLEYLPKGSLHDYLKTNGSLLEKDASRFTLQILEGIQYLHDVRIIHRDIKPANILLTDDLNLKLTDFGLSKNMENLTALNAQTCCGTVKYMAPELLGGREYNKSVDIWSLGVTVLEMLKGESIYPDLNPVQFLYKMCQPNFNFEYPEEMSDYASYFFKLTFVNSPQRRASANDLRCTKFILIHNNSTFL